MTLSIVSIAFSFILQVANARDTREVAIQDIKERIEALTKELEVLREQEAKKPSSISSSRALTQTLKFSVQGEEVLLLQNVLDVPETGIFDAATKEAVLVYQKVNQLMVDGVVGKRTRARLNAEFFAVPNISLPSRPAARIAVSLTTPFSASPSQGFIISGSASNTAGSQARANVLSLTFDVGEGNYANVYALALRQRGNSGDGALDAVYMYEQDEITRIADAGALVLGTVSFAHPNEDTSLFRIEGTKTIHILVDVSKQARWGETLQFVVDAFSDIKTDAGLVQGAFPLRGTSKMVVTVSDLGRLQIVPQYTPSSIDPGFEDVEMFMLDATAFDQDIEIRSMRLEELGGLLDDDLLNLHLEDAGNPGVVLAEGKLQHGVINFENQDPLLTLLHGSTKRLLVKGDVIGGAEKKLQLALEKSADLIAYDKNYKVGIKPDSGVVGVFNPVRGTAALIGRGIVTVRVSADSPQGVLELGTLSALLGKFDVGATGEDIRIKNIRLLVDLDDDDDIGPLNITDISLFYDGTGIVLPTTTLQDGSRDNDAVFGEGEDGSLDQEGMIDIATDLVVPKGTTRTLALFGTVGSLRGTARPMMRGDAVTVTLPPQGIVWEGVQTKRTGTSENAALPARTLRVIQALEE